MIKICRKCEQSKDILLFSKCAAASDGHKPYCKECVSKENREFYLKNRDKERKRSSEKYIKNIDKIKAYHKRYDIINKERIRNRKKITRKEYASRPEVKERRRKRLAEISPFKKERIKENRKKYLVKNKERILANRRQERLNKFNKDMKFTLSLIIRNRINNALKGKIKQFSAIKELGCTIDELKAFLESKFYNCPITNTPMTWENRGVNGWHIDHIIPLCSFDLTDPEQFKKACHYTNLQPLWAKENLAKGGRLW